MSALENLGSLVPENSRNSYTECHVKRFRLFSDGSENHFKKAVKKALEMTVFERVSSLAIRLMDEIGKYQIKYIKIMTQIASV